MVGDNNNHLRKGHLPQNGRKSQSELVYQQENETSVVPPPISIEDHLVSRTGNVLKKN
jgi:hypothetical protein